MPRRWFAIVVALTVLFAAFAWPRPVSACSCVPPDPPPQAFAAADGVFAGQVTGVSGGGSSFIDLLARFIPGLQPPYGRTVSFQVTDSWKGVTTAAIDLRTGYSGGDCGYTFLIGQSYLVYANQGDFRNPSSSEWTASLCSRTTEISVAATDLLYLQTLPKLALTPAPPSLWLLLCVGVVVLLVAVLFGAVGLRRRAARRSAAS